MKTNRSSSIAKKYMREKGDTKNRPEQLLVAEILKYHVTEEVTTEVKLKNLHAVDALDFTGKRAPRPDILMEYQEQKFVIRINGPSHDTDKREKYDNAQKIFLELQTKDHYRVIDVSYVRHELLFERNKRKLTKIELYHVLDLLHSEFLIYGIVFNHIRTSEWIENSQHKV